MNKRSFRLHTSGFIFHPFQIIILITWVLLLAFFFANVEIQIEGPNGWASDLPTWKMQNNRIAELLWADKPITGYHVWVFSFMLLAFHTPLIFLRTITLKLEARIIGSLMLFWIIEDAFWFALNPAFGLSKLKPEFVPWHRNWFMNVPVDYFIFPAIGLLLILFSFSGKRSPAETDR